MDLRSNPGGLLNESIDIVNLFVDKGEEIVITKGKINDWEKTYESPSINNMTNEQSHLSSIAIGVGRDVISTVVRQGWLSLKYSP